MHHHSADTYDTPEQRRGPHNDAACNAKVEGIMRVAGFVRQADGTWFKPGPAVAGKVASVGSISDAVSDSTRSDVPESRP